MPYEIKPENGQFCIYKQGTNDQIACHDTRESANRQIQALYANEKAIDDTGYAYASVESEGGIIPLAEYANILLGDIEGAYFNPAPIWHITLAHGRGIGRNTLQEIAQLFSFLEFEVIITGFERFSNERDYLVLKVEPNPYLLSLQNTIFGLFLTRAIISEHSIPANYTPHITIAEFPSGTLTDEIMRELNFNAPYNVSIEIEKVCFAIGDYIPVAETYAVALKYDLDFIIDFIDKHSAYESGFKALNNDNWIAWYTNNFEDKEGEIVSLKAMQESIDAANKGEYPMPELWFYHLDGTRHGQADKLFLIGHFAVAIGTFDSEASNEFVSIMKSWYDTQDNITVSQGFFYNPDMKKKGVYNWIRTREISSLPAGSEANEYTKFQVMQGV